MKKIIIIGGGIAGLTAGVYAQKAGFESVIYEKHTISGGECTGWDRKGFHIDGCIHWLTGTKDGTRLNKVWKDIGALEDVEIYQPDSFVEVQDEDTKVILYRDLDKFKAHLIEVSPEDTDEIKKLCEYIEPFYAFEPPTGKPFDQMNLMQKMKFYSSMVGIGGVVNSLGEMTVSEYLERFKNPTIRIALQSAVPEYYSAYILFNSLGTFMSGNGGRPKGGSRAFAQRIEDKYRSSGGTIKLGNGVSEILIENGIAIGVRLEDGTEDQADFIVPACDVHITFKKLLKDKYHDQEFVEKYQDEVTYPTLSSVYAAFGVDADLSAYPKDYLFRTKEFAFEDRKHDLLSIKHYCYEPSFAPDGKSVVIVYFHANYDWWKERHKNYDVYKAEKDRLAQDIISRIEEHFPELSGKISTIDLATPITYERYCGAYKGSWMAFGTTPKGKQLMHSGRMKEISNLYMAGQWLMPPGGLPTAVITGKWAIQRICSINLGSRLRTLGLWNK